jgi:riboflavin kinase/FMN adenylyltransferase
VIVLDGPLGRWKAVDSPSSVTIGVFDGVHLGHQALLRELDDRAAKTVLTFDPHPLEILRPGVHARLITTLGERIALLGSYGVERVGVLDLSEIKEYDPLKFVRDVLVERLDVAQLVVGTDFRFGRDRTGDVSQLAGYAVSEGFSLKTIDLVGDDTEVVSSSRIRHLIEVGSVDRAGELLGSRFQLTNTVIPGDQRGQGIGFPTANLAPPDRKVLPATGIYAAYVRVGGDIHGAAVNVGVRPTFGGGALLIEAHILDFDSDLYGREMTVEFVEYLREEMRFDGVDPLVEAMTVDVANARRVLDETSPNMS